MINPESLSEPWRRITSADSIALVCHIRPDGDTLGSSLALAHVLREMGKHVEVLCQDGVPDNYHFIPESKMVTAKPRSSHFDLCIIVDSAWPSRVGDLEGFVTSCPTSACIDHHVPGEIFGDIRVVDSEYSSTAEIVYDLMAANHAPMDETVAKQLLTGLIADTGAFRFENTSSHTFLVAAKLTKMGANASEIATCVYYTKPMRSLQLLGRALASLKTTDAGKIAWATISRADLEELGATDADTDGIVNHVSSVDGPLVCLLFREIGDEVRVSLRSRHGVDVNRIANAFGGGGHAAAAGCTVNATLDHAIEQVVQEVRKWTESY